MNRSSFDVEVVIGDENGDSVRYRVTGYVWLKVPAGMADPPDGGQLEDLCVFRGGHCLLSDERQKEMLDSRTFMDALEEAVEKIGA